MTILDDCCRCGHERSRHGEPAMLGGKVGCHDCDACLGFVRDQSRHWLVALRFADLVASHGGRMKVERIAPGDGRQGWKLEAFINSNLDILAPSDADETHGLVEQVVERWMRRLDVARDATSHVPLKQGDPAWRAPHMPCSTCHARADDACTPMHEGERDAGGWSHPTRAPTRTDSEVVRWARRRIGHDSEVVRWAPGVKSEDINSNTYALVNKANVRRAVDSVVDEILSLAYLNGLHTAPPFDTSTSVHAMGGVIGPERVSRDHARNPLYLFRAVGPVGIGDSVTMVDSETIERSRHSKSFGRVVAAGEEVGTYWVRQQ